MAYLNGAFRSPEIVQVALQSDVKCLDLDATLGPDTSAGACLWSRTKEFEMPKAWAEYPQPELNKEQ